MFMSPVHTLNFEPGTLNIKEPERLQQCGAKHVLSPSATLRINSVEGDTKTKKSEQVTAMTGAF
jgi:hypothetical protein